MKPLVSSVVALWLAGVPCAALAATSVVHAQKTNPSAGKVHAEPGSRPSVTGGARAVAKGDSAAKQPSASAKEAKEPKLLNARGKGPIAGHRPGDAAEMLSIASHEEPAAACSNDDRKKMQGAIVRKVAAPKTTPPSANVAKELASVALMSSTTSTPSGGGDASHHAKAIALAQLPALPSPHDVREVPATKAELHVPPAAAAVSKHAVKAVSPGRVRGYGLELASQRNAKIVPLGVDTDVEQTEPADSQLWRDDEIDDIVSRILKKQRQSASAAATKHTTTSSKSSGPLASSAPCLRDPVEIVRGSEFDAFSLSTCDGGFAPLALERLSVSIRPPGAPRPVAPVTELAKKAKGPEIAKGIRKLDERLALRIKSLVEHFSTVGSPVKLSIISGYRPTSVGSMHATGRAVDFRIEGVKNEDVVAFCKTLSDTGCGYYPNNSFVHLDVRDQGTGVVEWIDSSAPGDSPHYVSTWPLTNNTSRSAPLEQVAQVRAETTGNDRDEVRSVTAPADHPDACMKAKGSTPRLR